jgi:putative flippase GtrA
LLLAETPFGPFVSRIISIAFAMVATWILNRAFTFGPSDRPVAEEGARYGAVAIAVAGFNWLLYSTLVILIPTIGPLGALIVASGVAMALSYLGYSRAVFARA